MQMQKHMNEKWKKTEQKKRKEKKGREGGGVERRQSLYLCGAGVGA